MYRAGPIKDESYSILNNMGKKILELGFPYLPLRPTSEGQPRDGFGLMVAGGVNHNVQAREGLYLTK